MQSTFSHMSERSVADAGGAREGGDDSAAGGVGAQSPLLLIRRVKRPDAAHWAPVEALSAEELRKQLEETREELLQAYKVNSDLCSTLERFMDNYTRLVCFLFIYIHLMYYYYYYYYYRNKKWKWNKKELLIG